jgi:hypothetical protein
MGWASIPAALDSSPDAGKWAGYGMPGVGSSTGAVYWTGATLALQDSVKAAGMWAGKSMPSTATVGALYNVGGTLTWKDSVKAASKADSAIKTNDTLTLAHGINAKIFTAGSSGVIGSTDPVFLVERAVSDATGSGNAHAFADNTVITRSGKIGYNSYDMEVSIGAGTSNTYDHYAGFQFIPTYASSGKMDNMYANYIAPIVNGPLGNYYGTTVGTPTGSGVIDQAIGFYLNMTNTRATTNYSIYSNGLAPSYFAGKIGAMVAADSALTAAGIHSTTNALINGHLDVGVTSRFSLWGDYAGYQEIPAGALMGGMGTNGNIGILASLDAATAGLKVAMLYSSTVNHYYSAAEIANVASGYGTLLLMKSGGRVAIGASSTSIAKLEISGDASVDAILKLIDVETNGHSFWLYPRGTGGAGGFQLYDATSSKTCFNFDGSQIFSLPAYTTNGVLKVTGGTGLISSSTNMDSGAVTVGAIPVAVTNTHTLTASNLSEASNVLTATDSLYLNGYGIYSTHGFKCATISNLDTTVFVKGISAPVIQSTGVLKTLTFANGVDSGTVTIGAIPVAVTTDHQFTASTATNIAGAGIQVTGTTNVRYDLWSSSADAASRNWCIVSNHDEYGDLHIRTSNANGGNPYGATGTARFVFKPDGDMQTSSDLSFLVTAKGPVLKDSNGHYWREGVTTGGAVTTTDLGTTPP